MKNYASLHVGALRAGLLLGACGLALGVAGAAHAQEQEELAPPADEYEGEELALPAGEYVEDEEEANLIFVTATKRERTLQDVPVAVSVATAETMEQAQIRDLKDLQTIVPSLRVTQLQSTATTNFIIRGFGNGANNAGIEPSVGVFVDGVYRSRTASQINDLPNVQRVEVLRGPQSTLFGKNASAGVISIVTEAPQFQPGGMVEATYGKYNAFVTRGYMTGPVSDDVALSIAGGYNSRDGYNRNLGTGNRTNEVNRWFVRGQALIEPSSDLTIRLIADYDKLDENCCGVINVQPSQATGVINLLGGQVPDANDPWANVVYTNYDPTNDVENWGLSGQIDYNIGLLQLTSITSYRESKNATAIDADFSSADLIYPLYSDVRLNTFTQELRASLEFADMFSALLGVFYINEGVEQTGGLKWGSDARNYADYLVQSLSGGALGINLLEGTFGALEADPTKYQGTFFAKGTGFDEAYTLNSDAISVFGQVDVEIAKGLTLTLGGNYTHDSKDYTANILSSDSLSAIDFDAAGYAPFRYQLLYQGALAGGADATAADAFAMANMNNPEANPLNPLRELQFLPPFVDVPNAVEDGKISDDNFSYTIRVAYDVSPDLNIYASYATGFKASSVNLSRDSRPLAADVPALADAGLVPVNLTPGSRFASPEESRVIEVGLKGRWFGGSANVAVFDQQIEGFQSNVFTGAGFALANAGKQSTFGVELEAQQEVTPGFGVSLGVTYLDPIYDDFQFSSVGDLTGTKPAGIPEWTVVVGGQYNHEFDNGDRVILSGSYNFESDVQMVDGLPGFIADGQEAAIAAAAQFSREVNDVNASITYAHHSGVEFSLWGRNLLNDRYLLSLFDSVAQPRSISSYPNQPLTWGGTVRYKW